jgi:hypothetical protein
MRRFVVIDWDEDGNDEIPLRRLSIFLLAVCRKLALPWLRSL